MGRMAIFAMGVGPYINSSIIISLLQGAHVIPYLDHLAKEGQQGQKQMNQITRYLTLALGALQSFGFCAHRFLKYRRRMECRLFCRPMPGGSKL